MTTDPDWQQPFLERLGAEISAARQARGMSAVAVSEAAADLGVTIHRVAVSRIEKGTQAATAPELAALGAVLQTNWVGWLYRAAEGLALGDEDKLRADLAVKKAALEKVRAQREEVRVKQEELRLLDDGTLAWEELDLEREVREAEDALAELLGRQSQPTPAVPDDGTLQRVAENWMDADAAQPEREEQRRDA